MAFFRLCRRSLRVPSSISQKKKGHYALVSFGAGGGTSPLNPSVCLCSALPKLSAIAPRGTKNAALWRFFGFAAVPFESLHLSHKRKKGHYALISFGAGGGTRTHTMSPSTDFESVTSANSITPACLFIITQSCYFCKPCFHHFSSSPRAVAYSNAIRTYRLFRKYRCLLPKTLIVITADVCSAALYPLSKPITI